MTDTDSKFKNAKLSYKTFISEFQTLQMATVDKDGFPNASYSPYLKHENDFYIYVSELSAHTKNLNQTGKASIFFVENEEQAQHIYARRRITYSCTVSEVQRTKNSFNQIMDKFGEKFGISFINMIRELEDFHLFKLSPEKGIFVNGFAQAYETSGEGMSELIHKNDMGHRAKDKKTQNKMASTG